jgi:hypothetical protein
MAFCPVHRFKNCTKHHGLRKTRGASLQAPTYAGMEVHAEETPNDIGSNLYSLYEENEPVESLPVDKQPSFHPH